ncbi:MAG: hypothetical protein CMF48_02300 [Legionellales bacterium]|nr:hypothetical protein [Legionellales bacterium]
MEVFLQVIIAGICGFLVWRIYKVLKTNPELLSKENMTKSISTMGVLALILIGFVAIMVMSLR